MKKKKRGKGAISPEDGKQFTSDYQPTPEAKSQGKRRKRELREIADALINAKGLDRAKAIAESLGIDLSDNEFTLEVCLTLRQIEKAIKQADTKAYIAAMDRLKGKPLQTKIVGKTKAKKEIFKIGNNTIYF